MPPAIDLSAYRIVQEGLTNVIKHAGESGSAAVSVTFRPTRIDLAVCNTGRASGTVTSPSGHGLDGLRERVTLLNGDFRAERGSDGGFELEVSLPVPPMSA